METLRNLDRVLGIRQQTVKIRRSQVFKKAAPTLPTLPKTNINFPDFVEKVNGRCAATGLIAGKAMYEFTGQDLNEQLFLNPDLSLLLITGDIALVTALTLALYKPMNYEDLWEFGEIVMYRYAMVRWAWIIGGIFFQ